MSLGLDTIPTGQTGAPTTADPNAAVTPQVPTAEPQAPQDEFKYRLPTGTVYRDEQELINGAIEKDYAIERFKTRIAQLEGAQYNRPAPQVPPPAQANGMDALAGEIYQDMKAEFPDRDDADLRAWAKVQAKREAARDARVLKTIGQTTKAQQWEAEHRQIVTKDPSFNISQDGSLAAEIFDSNPGLSPKQHYALYLLERSERGLGVAPTAPSTAAAGMYSRGFVNTGGSAPTSVAPSGSNDPYVIQAVETAKAKGHTDPAYLAQVRQTAIEALPFVLKNRR